MKPATSSKRLYENTKLLFIDSRQRTQEHSNFSNLKNYFRPGDLLVVNMSGTIPASFRFQKHNDQFEMRLAAFAGKNLNDFSVWQAVTFGQGDWRIPTEGRTAAPVVEIGEVLKLSKTLEARVIEVSSQNSRLLKIKFESKYLLRDLYKHGKPIQYSYLTEELRIWDQQTIFSGPPISVEPPSAAFPLNWRMILDLQHSGVQVATIVHGAGLSSTGSAELDSELPLAEYFEIPDESFLKIKKALTERTRIIAVGTTVTRALETAFSDVLNPRLRGLSSLKLGPASKLKVVNGLLTGMHEAGTSHLCLLSAFTGADTERLVADNTSDYRSHEYGDSTLIMG